MHIKNDFLFDLDGNFIPQQDAQGRPILGSRVTVAWCLMVMALGTAPQGQSWTADHVVDRLAMGIEAYRLPPGGVLDLDEKLARVLRDDAPRFFGPILAGQLVVILRGGPPPLSAAQTAEEPAAA